MVEHEKASRRYFLLPGGGVDPGEDWAEAAARELSEELGVGATVGPLIGIYRNVSPDGSRRILHAVFAAEVTGEPASTGEDPRVVGCRWVDADELATLKVFPDLGETFRVWLVDGAPGGAACGEVAWVD